MRQSPKTQTGKFRRYEVVENATFTEKTQSGKSRRYLEVVENATFTENSVGQISSLS